ncbi:MAG: 4Fe-4S binding protein [Merdibacter sp.]
MIKCRICAYDAEDRFLHDRNVSFNRSIEEAECSLCGQCITHCPVNALYVGRQRTRDRRVQRS